MAPSGRLRSEAPIKRVWTFVGGIGNDAVPPPPTYAYRVSQRTRAWSGRPATVDVLALVDNIKTHGIFTTTMVGIAAIPAPPAGWSVVYTKTFSTTGTNAATYTMVTATFNGIPNATQKMWPITYQSTYAVTAHATFYAYISPEPTPIPSSYPITWAIRTAEFALPVMASGYSNSVGDVTGPWITPDSSWIASLPIGWSMNGRMANLIGANSVGGTAVKWESGGTWGYPPKDTTWLTSVDYYVNKAAYTSVTNVPLEEFALNAKDAGGNVWHPDQTFKFTRGDYTSATGAARAALAVTMLCGIALA